MRNFLAAVLSCGLCAGGAFARNFSSSAKGAVAGDFLELGVDGRAMGMGGAYSAAADGASALYWNPAALTRVEHRAAAFMHAAYLDSSYFDYGAYAQNMGKYGAFGASFQYFSAGSIAQTDGNFNSIGSFAPNAIALSAGYAGKLADVGAPFEGAAIGVSAKYIRSTILNTAQTAAFDFGVLSPEYFDRRLRLAFAAANVGGTLRYQQSAENLPLEFRVGSAFHVTERWLTSLDAASPRDNAPYAALGTEYLFPVASSWSVAGRLGYNSRTMSGVTGVSGASIGLGLASRRFRFDYAFIPFGGLGITNRFSISAEF